MLDECEGSRQEARERLDQLLCAPLDGEQDEHYRSERAAEQWQARALQETQGAQALDEARARDELFAAVSY